MIRGMEFAGFVALAAAVHAGIWVVTPEGGSAGGEGGSDPVTLAASSPQRAAMVAEWERPVPVQDTAPAARPTPTPDAQPAAPRPDPAPRAAPAAPEAPEAPRAPQTAALPGIDRAPPEARAPSPPATRPQARPAAEPAQPAPSRRAETARGTGNRTAGGAAKSTAPARLDAAARTSLMGQWGGAIRTRIERQKRYPAGTRASGTVHLVLDVGADGRLEGVGVRRSSGNARLDAAAIEAVRRARLPAAPDRLPGARHRFNLPVAFAR